ncbi:putative quinol monooxygenase [Hirschia baltica]|uniref:Antibiotic biosynthesis monooxygenase n=1 Tax=Hirschia baltica (strain ATCC 49814 / DSM 5838 / IFAM 1418) TaxID=582402 RepID=C6XNP6_HIRBI|nr:putative quinol monooxygenase [Hirschia baltica]ACT58299.1 Antibiotic biosynthesis monooxygenase [Hirschia baltica ATCC 49814]
MIGVTAKLEIQDGKQEEFEAIAKELVAKVNANEEGCLMYQLFKTQNSKTSYVFMEQYNSIDAIITHGKTEYFQAAQQKLGGCLAGAPVIEMHDLIG